MLCVYVRKKALGRERREDQRGKVARNDGMSQQFGIASTRLSTSVLELNGMTGKPVIMWFGEKAISRVQNR